MSRNEIKYQKGACEVTGFNVDLKVNPIVARLRHMKAEVDRMNGVLCPSKHPFDKHWLLLGTSFFGWWRIIGNHGDMVGKDGLILERVDGPYAIICLN